MTEFELPSLLPLDDLEIARTDGESVLPVSSCTLLGHNVAPDGKPNPIQFDDPYFVFVYQHADSFFIVRGLNPEMMSGAEVASGEAEALLEALPYRTV